MITLFGNVSQADALQTSMISPLSSNATFYCTWININTGALNRLSGPLNNLPTLLTIALSPGDIFQVQEIEIYNGASSYGASLIFNVQFFDGLLGAAVNIYQCLLPIGYTAYYSGTTGGWIIFDAAGKRL